MTAVEWLDEQLQDTMYFVVGYTDGVRKVTIPLEDYMRLKQEALEMEKEQKVENKDSFGEISDEEIEKGAEEKYPYNELRDGEFKGMLISAKKNAWVDAIKWYREQLKTKQ